MLAHGSSHQAHLLWSCDALLWWYHLKAQKETDEEGADLKSSFKGTYHLPKPPPTPDSTSGCWPLACALGWAWET